MDWIKGVQDVAPWLTGLPPYTKMIFSGLVVGFAAFVLAVIWTPAPDTAVQSILTGCHRRAMFTRMHAQMDVDAMFASIGECREIIQKNISSIREKELQATALELLATVEGIERRNPIKGPADVEQINKLKLAAVNAFSALATATGNSYPLPEKGKLAEAVYFTQEEANAPLTPADLLNQNAVDPTTGETVFH